MHARSVPYVSVKRRQSVSRLKDALLVIFCFAYLILVVGCVTGNTSNSSGPTPTTPTTNASLATWKNSFLFAGFQFPFTMVGTDPSVAGAGTTNIPVKIIPVTFTFAGNVFSPTAVACGDTTNAISRVQNSPLFTNFAWGTGGTTQYTDAFQRTNFWNFVNTISPNYHVLLQPVITSSPVTIDVPTTTGAFVTGNPACPQHPFLTLPLDFVNGQAQQIIASQNITADTLPVFISFNAQFVPPNGNPLTPALGYHTAIGNQTFVVASYMDFGGTAGALPPGIPGDVSLLSHELGEWMDDPTGQNRVPPWGNVGQVSTCSSQLEVGDPLSDRIFAVAVPGFTYHIQELAYFSWFAREVPSRAAGGIYSTGGTFLTPPPVLPNGPDCP